MASKPLEFKMPSGLDLDEQTAFCIGNLVASWANCESMFYGILNCIVGKPNTEIGSTLWLSIKSTKARVDLTLQMLNAISIPDGIKAEILECANQFDGITRTRNFYCHSFYRIDPASLELTTIESYSFDPRARSYSLDAKKLNKATINELADAIKRSTALNTRIWGPFLQLREHLKAQHVELPEPFPEFLRPK